MRGPQPAGVSNSSVLISLSLVTELVVQTNLLMDALQIPQKCVG